METQNGNTRRTFGRITIGKPNKALLGRATKKRSMVSAPVRRYNRQRDEGLDQKENR